MFELTDSVLKTIALKHNLAPPTIVAHARRGATSSVVPCGDVVIKIPFDTAEAIHALRTDVAMNGFARRLGVQTPELIVFDEDCHEPMPVPYAVFRRVSSGVTLQESMATGDAPRQAWFALGQQLSLVHAVIPETEVPVPLREFRQSAAVDPQPWVTELLAAGSLTSDDAMWLRRLLEDLAPVALADNEGDRLLRLCHGDVNASNVLVASDTGAFRAVIDWAGAGWLDPV
jgi:aminoglycoside phosphotransferase (APT) family kinase protein